jgi:hypothetical protein
VAARGSNPVDVRRNIRIHRFDRGLSQVGTGKPNRGLVPAGAKIRKWVQPRWQRETFQDCRGVGSKAADYSGSEVGGDSPISMLSGSYALRLLKAVCDIDDPELRRLLVELAEKLAAKRRNSRDGRPGIETVTQAPLLLSARAENIRGSKSISERRIECALH